MTQSNNGSAARQPLKIIAGETYMRDPNRGNASVSVETLPDGNGNVSARLPGDKTGDTVYRVSLSSLRNLYHTFVRLAKIADGREVLPQWARRFKLGRGVSFYIHEDVVGSNEFALELKSPVTLSLDHGVIAKGAGKQQAYGRPQGTQENYFSFDLVVNGLPEPGKDEELDGGKPMSFVLQDGVELYMRAYAPGRWGCKLTHPTMDLAAAVIEVSDIASKLVSRDSGGSTLARSTSMQQFDSLYTFTMKVKTSTEQPATEATAEEPAAEQSAE